MKYQLKQVDFNLLVILGVVVIILIKRRLRRSLATLFYRLSSSRSLGMFEEAGRLLKKIIGPCSYLCTYEQTNQGWMNSALGKNQTFRFLTFYVCLVLGVVFLLCL
jgi:hypothetical protein